MIAIPVCLGSLAVNLSGIIDLLTVTGRLSHVMDTAPQQLLACYGQNIPQAELVNGTVHNYLYGAYSGKAVVIANLVPALTTGMAVSALPAVAESFARGNRLRTQKSIQMVLRITALFCVPAGLGISALSQEVCSLFFGMNSEVMVGAPLLRVLGLASIFIALTGTTNSLLQAVGRVSLPVKLILIGSAIKLAMNYLLVGIPQLNIQAAPWSTLVCYVVITLLSLIALRSTGGSAWCLWCVWQAAVGRTAVCRFCTSDPEYAYAGDCLPFCGAAVGCCGRSGVSGGTFAAAGFKKRGHNDASQG